MVDRLQRKQSGSASCKGNVCALLGPLFQRVGWDAKPEEELATKLLRSDLIRTLGAFGDRGVIDEAFRRFEESRKGKADLSPDLRRAVTEVVGRYSSTAIYDELYQSAQQAPMPEAKQDF